MNNITTSIAVALKKEKRDSLSLSGLMRIFRGTGEMFGFVTSFMLFVIMGPFSVLAVVPALFSLCSEKNRVTMREPESC
jgi:hypothetical protein